MTSTDSLDLDAIEARATAATPGPWRLCDDYSDVLNPDGYQLASYAATTDGEFIAHAPEDVRALVAEVRRLHAELADARANALREAADEAEGATGLFSDSDEGAAAAGALEGLAIRFRRMADAAQPVTEGAQR